ncbi:PCI domain-containing protein [Cordyceps fumosorosea ARSEF 2679]|uniref:PCI domain-containing protein n=1 Tax=Cordyceps fumosorosea (strain ARSEF 2679) TaxID=1081104 RepID=A0A167UEI8_CORFA|nr:PCI domain-containing protein [Cordyceps fumosorosea ARSEF 2679]OAA61505.1 PCI domain-containing protein [Cordyceps fumosorosea ARSEF 2679]
MALVREFLSAIREQVRRQQGDALRDWLQVDSSSGAQYHNLGTELRARFPAAADVDGVVEECLPLDDDSDDDGDQTVASPWPGLQSFIKDYLVFWRDIDYDDLLGAHQLLSGLVNSCATAFAHPSYGGMLLQASMSLSETLARLTMMLNRRPDLTRKLRSAAPGDEDKASVAESSAEIIQKIFTTCLNDRSNPRASPPVGRRAGVYMFANLVLKLLFACKRGTNLARIVFSNVAAASPRLAAYPAAQRVAFLYYLGRFNLANGHARRAALCLEAAYLQTPPVFQRHRTAILTYLIPANVLLGRFPSRTRLLARPEAAPTLAPVFGPLCDALRKGNFPAFQAHVAAHERWLLARGLLPLLSSRLRPLLWRALSRRAFLLTPRRLRPNEGLVWGNAEVTYEDVEMVVAALVQQGLLHGFVAHGQARFAVMGAKAKGGPLRAGWPPVWQAIRARQYDEGEFDIDEVPGWVKG